MSTGTPEHVPSISMRSAKRSTPSSRPSPVWSPSTAARRVAGTRTRSCRGDAGQDFNATPWSPEQCALRPDIVVALETNLLTEDNLPYYHANIDRIIGGNGGAWREWSRLWTAEEFKHGVAMRDYFHLTRVMDPRVLEDDRHQAMEVGFDRDFGDPLELLRTPRHRSSQRASPTCEPVRTPTSQCCSS